MSFINHTHKFIFVHIPKTAGKSIETACSALSNNHKVTRHTRLKDIHNQFSNTIDYYTLTCVRDPWDRQCSLYFYVLQQCRKKKQEQKIIELEKGFEQFLQSRYFDEDHQHEWFDHLLTNQIEWFDDLTKVDQIIKFETIQQGWESFNDRMNIDINLPYNNTSKKLSNYRSFYNDATKKLIEKRFEKDIDTFKYIF